MREIQILVTLQVDECDPAAKFSRKTMEQAALEAVTNELHNGENHGFEHRYANDLCVGFFDAKIYDEDDEDDEEEGGQDEPSDEEDEEDEEGNGSDN